MIVSLVVSVLDSWRTRRDPLGMNVSLSLQCKEVCYAPDLSTTHHLRYDYSPGITRWLWTECNQRYDWSTHNDDWTFNYGYQRLHTGGQDGPCDIEQSEQPDDLFPRSSDELYRHSLAATEGSATGRRKWTSWHQSLQAWNCYTETLTGCRTAPRCETRCPVQWLVNRFLSRHIELPHVSQYWPIDDYPLSGVHRGSSCATRTESTSMRGNERARQSPGMGGHKGFHR